MPNNNDTKTYVFDIDGTICTNTYGDYENAEPYNERIKYINNLYADGNKIIMFTNYCICIYRIFTIFTIIYTFIKFCS